MPHENATKKDIPHIIKVALSVSSVLFGIFLFTTWLNTSRDINPEIIFSVLFIICGIILFTKYGE